MNTQRISSMCTARIAQTGDDGNTWSIYILEEAIVEPTP